jgi:hypothetical protein
MSNHWWATGYGMRLRNNKEIVRAVPSQSALVATQCCSKHLSAVLPSIASVNTAITQQ